MSSVVYSPLCDKNSSLYLAYLFSTVCNGERVVVDESKCRGRDAGTNIGSRVDIGIGIAGAYRDFCRSTLGENGLAEASGTIDDNVVAGSGYDVAVFRGAREVIGISDSSSASDVGGLDSGSCDGEHATKHTQAGLVDNPPVTSVPGAFGRKKDVDVFSERGRHYERNCANREKKRLRKEKKRAIQGKNWRGKIVQKSDNTVPALDCGIDLPVKDGGVSGFWNSCSKDIRQELIDSKARMHIASNNKKAEEDERRVKQLQSPEQILRDAMRLVNFANEQAKQKNDTKVSGWAMTVANSYAETIAKSAPDSVQSYESFVNSKASSLTSVDVLITPEAYNDKCVKLENVAREKRDMQEQFDKKLKSVQSDVQAQIQKQVQATIAELEKKHAEATRMMKADNQMLRDSLRTNLRVASLRDPPGVVRSNLGVVVGQGKGKKGSFAFV